jgi:hypothetical protein
MDVLKKMLAVLGFALVLVAMFFSLGCQVDGAISVSGKTFYPDQVGKDKVGDPRKGVYTPGHAESHGAGRIDRTPAAFASMSDEKGGG